MGAKAPSPSSAASFESASSPPPRLFSGTTLALQIGLVVVLFCVTYLAYRVTRSFVTFNRDAYSSKVDLSDSYVQPGLNVDSLPIVKIDFGKYRPNENTGDPTTDGNTDDESIAARRVRCLQRGVYLGPKNEYVDCSEYCRVGSEKEVKYTYISDPSRIITGRVKVSAGAWCLPTTAANCNIYSALVVYSLNGWICLPRTDALVGEGGNRIAVCNGTLWDNALRVRYDEFIPYNLAFDDFYEDRLPDGRFRFECLPDQRDELRNRYLVAPFNRFHLLRNFCVSDIPFAIERVVPDYDTGKCNCGGSPYTESKDGRCTACQVGFDDSSLTFNLRRQPCFSLRDYVSYVQYLRDTLPADEIIRPCGIDSTGSTNSEVTRPRCIINQVAMYSPLLPSAATMRNIREKLQGT